MQSEAHLDIGKNLFEAFAKDQEKWLDGARTCPETLGVLKASTDGNLVSQFRPEYLGTFSQWHFLAPWAVMMLLVWTGGAGPRMGQSHGKC